MSEKSLVDKTTEVAAAVASKSPSRQRKFPAAGAFSGLRSQLYGRDPWVPRTLSNEAEDRAKGGARHRHPG